MRPVNTRKEFETVWNGMGIVDGQTVSIDSVTIISHGNERSIILEDGSSYEALSIDGKNSKGQNIGNINDLQDKDIGELYLYSCNAGHLDQFSKGGCNVASVFSNKIKGEGDKGIVYAYDGNVGFGPSYISKFTDKFGYEPRLSNKQSSFHSITKKYNNSISHKNPIGIVLYNKGKRLPNDYVSNTQFSKAS